MSKTNHRRGIEAQRDGERYRHSPMDGTGRASELAAQVRHFPNPPQYVFSPPRDVS